LNWFEIVKPGTHVDFIGRRWLAVMLSAGVILASLVAIPIRGIRMGIDFAGGTEMQLAFAKDVPASDGAIREVLTGTLGILEPDVVRYGEQQDNEFLVRFARDINPEADEAAARGAEAAEPGADAGAGDGSDRRGSDLVERLTRALASEIGAVTVERVEFVGARVGKELRNDGLLALFYASLGILVYIAFRFNLRYAPGAIIASIHDLIVTSGLLVILGIEFDLRILAALLAILGYSLNDTIVIYDRVRENMALHTSFDLVTVLNESVNQTLSRTIITGGTTLLSVSALYLLGGPVIQPFALTMLLGIVVGTYSSVFIAAPLLLVLERRYGRGAAHEQFEKQKRAKRSEAASPGVPGGRKKRAKT
jgi:preprotein translocase subunit SecF